MATENQNGLTVSIGGHTGPITVPASAVHSIGPVTHSAHTAAFERARGQTIWLGGLIPAYDGWTHVSHGLRTMDLLVQPYGGPIGYNSIWLFEAEILSPTLLRIRAGHQDSGSGVWVPIEMKRVVLVRADHP